MLIREKELEDLRSVCEEKGYQAGFDAAVEQERSERLNTVDMLLKEAKKKSDQEKPQQQD